MMMTREDWKREIKEWTQSIIVAFIITLIIRSFVIQAFKIPSGSMRPTLMEGDKLFVSKLLYKPKRGDIVVFKYPYPEPIIFAGENIQIRNHQIIVNDQVENDIPFYKKYYYLVVFHFLGDRDFIKRLVAFEDEVVEIKNGKIYVDGKPLADSTTFGKFYYYNHDPYGGPDEKIRVPKNSYYVLGDNSANSTDSRFWGFVPKANMIGKAVFRWWPPKKIGTLK